MSKIGYLGPKGTFTEMATRAVFPHDVYMPYTTIPKCMDAISRGEVDYAVVPIENAIEGSVNLTMDYLIHKHTVPVIAEVIVPIEQQLMIHEGNQKNWTLTEKVFSHPHAIAQCHDFLRNVLPEADLQYTNSTGAAAQYVKENPQECVAAIANEMAAKEYGLKIVEQNIHDYDNNHTRFVILCREDDGCQEVLPSPNHIGYKTTLMVTLPADYSGALHNVLSAFAWRKLNLSKIESRPMKTGLGNYFFVIDIDQKMDDVLIPGAIAELEALNCGVRVLGSYPCLSLSKTKKPVPE